jgi:hypothetical protein
MTLARSGYERYVPQQCALQTLECPVMVTGQSDPRYTHPSSSITYSPARRRPGPLPVERLRKLCQNALQHAIIEPPIKCCMRGPELAAFQGADALERRQDIVHICTVDI